MGYAPNKYGEVDNRAENYTAIAADLTAHRAVIVPWIDGLGTLYDVQFSLPKVVGHLGSGNMYGYLFVSVHGKGAYGFIMAPRGVLAPDYIAEKLGIKHNETAKRLGDLITGVIQASTPHEHDFDYSVYPAGTCTICGYND